MIKNMMDVQRKIKFRIWNGKRLLDENFGVFSNYTLSDGRLVRKAGDYNNGEGWTEPTIDLVEQYTGLKDKDGVEIYEGDILYNWSQESTGSVDWVNDKSAFMVATNDYEPMHFEPYECKVIGNIHENPELLKK